MKTSNKFGLLLLISALLFPHFLFASTSSFFKKSLSLFDTTDLLVRKQLQLLDQAERRINELKNAYDFSPIIYKGRSLKLGDTSSVVLKIKQRLFILGDFQGADFNSNFDSTLSNSILHFERRNGLSPDGLINRVFLKSLNTPMDLILQKIKINKSKWEQLSFYLEGVLLMVNIPDYSLSVYDGGREVRRMKVIVGKPDHPTARFEGNLKYVVFCPYWNIPPNILKKEILPEIARHPGYLTVHHMEWHDKGIRQLPGKDNALGDVKFLFPNRYNIYMHDTPFKSLFSKFKRPYSHGCIRLEDATWLANFIMAKEMGWDSLMVNENMKQGKETYHELSGTIKVVIAYFTLWIDDNGEIQMRDDLYNLDKIVESTKKPGENPGS